MARGRIPAPAALNQLKGDSHKRRRHEAEPPAPKGRPEKPRHLDPVAAAEWDRVCDDLEAMGTLHSSDRVVIEMFCSAYSRYVRAEQQLQKFGDIILGHRNVPSPSPYHRVLKEEREALRKLGIEMGLTPAARARMRTEAPKTTADDVFRRIVLRQKN
jgi:P27 family predicted phage terminase small subunit